MNRPENLQKLANETFDICVIGGGASGAGVALDAALRGYKVALLERSDFSAETSSRSTKLIHGGVRYLEQAFKKLDLSQLKQVKHGLEERKFVLQNAPHLAHPLAIITPVKNWFEGAYFRIGLALYDFFARHDTMPRARWLSRADTFLKMPNLHPDLHSGVQYYDGQLNDARYNLALVQAAAEVGAAVVNYVQLVGFQKDSTGKLMAAEASDCLTAKGLPPVTARLFINCTGPFSDAIRLMANPAEESRIRPSKGVHIVLPLKYLASAEALLIPKTSDGRLVFAIPFQNYLMVGTTDTPYESVENEPILLANETTYLLDTLKPYLREMPDKQEVTAGFGGIRPLISSKAITRKSTKSLLRDHALELDEKSGLLSLLGGKWTTYRLMAQDTVDAAESILGRRQACQTKHHTLPGGAGFTEVFQRKFKEDNSLPQAVANHLLSHYGSRAEQVLSHRLPLDAPTLLPEVAYQAAEVRYAVRHEMAVTLRDVLARRWRIEFLDWPLTIQLLESVADVMAAELDWTTEQKSNEIANYQAYLAKIRHNALP